MRFTSWLKKPIINAVMLVGMAAIWFLFAPTQFGGQVSYVMIAGASMEPELRWGDLVIAKEADRYQVGDVITYQHPIVGPVIHRIIEKSSNSYTLKGDNNDWIDSYSPSKQEIIGKAWIHVPSAASILQKLRTPLGLSLLSVCIGIMVLVTLTSSGSTDQTSGSKMKGKKFINTQALGALGEGWLFTLATLLLASILLGVFAFTKPMMQMAQEDIPYEHQGNFSYQADAAPNIYDYGRIETGDPIFHSLASNFDVTFDYVFTSPAEATSSGSYRVLLEVSEPNGWRRINELVPSTEFSNGGFSTSATIDLEYIQSLIEALELHTGFKRSPYDVRIIPIVRSEATVAGHPFFEQFAPALHFKLDDYQLYIDGANPLEEENSPLLPIVSGTQADFRPIPASITILGIDFSVEAARWITGIIFTVSLLGLGVILYPIMQGWRKSESFKIALQYGDQLLEVDKLPKIKAAQTIGVSSFPDLVKIAESTNELILHHSHKGKHTYLLHLDENSYRYMLQDEWEEDQT